MTEYQMHTGDMLGRQEKFSMTIELPERFSHQAERCFRIAKETLELFVQRNAGYGNTAYTLGARGQFADMNRKMGKLHHTLWDGNEPVGESIEEMLFDMVGHCLLTIDFLRAEKNK